MNINQPALLLITAAVLSLLLSVFAWRQKQNTAGVYLALLMTATTIWSLFYGLEILIKPLYWMKLTLILSYIGISTIPAFWLFFTAHYSGIDKWIKPPVKVLIWIIPVVTMGMVLTNDFHHLYYRDVEVGYLTNHTFLKLTSGTFWWVHIIYSHVLSLAGFIFLIRLFFRVIKEQRIHIFFFLIGSILPYLFNVLYVSGFRPYGFLDLTPLAFNVMGLFFSIGVFSIKLFDINPLAIDLFFRNTPDAIIVRNTNGIVVNANPAAQELLKSPSFRKIILSGDVTGFRKTEPRDYLPETREIVVYDRIFQQTNTLIFGNNQKNIGSLTIFRDITKDKQTELELKKLANLQSLLMNMASKYINLKIDDMENGINESLGEMGMFSRADRTFILEIDYENQEFSNSYEWCADGIDSLKKVLQKLPLQLISEWLVPLKSGDSLFIKDICNLDENSAFRELLEPFGLKTVFGIPIIEDNLLTGLIGFQFNRQYNQISENDTILLVVFEQILVNLRERAQMEKKLIGEKEKANMANKAKSEFLANMSHEIRTPMNSILGFTEVILNTTSDKSQEPHLRTILESGKSLLTLINDILDLSKIEAGRMEITYESTDLRDIVNEMKQMFFYRVQEKNIAFKTEIDPLFPKAIVIDELRIRQILLNLVGNAVKFTHKGYVMIKVYITEKKPESLSFSMDIIDTGIGITGKDYNELFESFTQQPGLDKRKYQGTGLGLAITRRLTELMNGTIEVESKPGHGSRFSVHFQDIRYQEREFEKTEKFTWDKNHIKFMPSKILIADDIVYNRTLVIKFLDKYDLQLFTAENGEEAVNASLKYKPDLIFMDIRMPVMDGFEAAGKIKSMTETSHIPIVALTASTMKNETEQIYEVFDGYLSKPVQRTELLHEMLRFLPYTSAELSGKNETVPNVEKDEMPKLPESIIYEFRKNFSGKLVKQNGYLILDDLKILTSDLIGFSEQHNLDFLTREAKDLQRNIEFFDFDKIQGNLSMIRDAFI